MQTAIAEQAQTLPSFKVLGVRVHAIQIPDAVAQLESWVRNRERGRYVAVTGMHGVSESRKDGHFREILNSADLVVPDGMPLVWLGRWHRCPVRERVYGPELLDTFCRETGARYRHFFYGGAPGVADLLAETLQRHHGIVVAGTYTPPFRPLTREEDEELARRVEQSRPDLLWVGLSTPKQERWMYEHRAKLRAAVMIGVGAAFDMNSGQLRRAPAWMRNHGLEWFFRLVVEPRRLWRRYLVIIPKTTWFVALELFQSLIRSQRNPDSELTAG